MKRGSAPPQAGKHLSNSPYGILHCVILDVSFGGVDDAAEKAVGEYLNYGDGIIGARKGRIQAEGCAVFGPDFPMRLGGGGLRNNDARLHILLRKAKVLKERICC